MNATIYTIGHSNHSLEGFLDLLTVHNITAVADVRSQPVSSYTPHFSRDLLAPALEQQGISYVFLGQQLGGRSTNQACYKNGRLQYSQLALEPSFDSGITRVKKGTEQFRIALMCSEKTPSAATARCWWAADCTAMASKFNTSWPIASCSLMQPWKCGFWRTANCLKAICFAIAATALPMLIKSKATELRTQTSTNSTKSHASNEALHHWIHPEIG